MFFQSPRNVENSPLSGCQVKAARRCERGAALVLALLVVVVVSLLASTLGSDFLVTYKRVENQLLSKQAFALLRGAEGIARSTLQADLRLAAEKDHASEGWLNVTQEFPLDQGVISGTICDLQGRFNLNSLSAANSNGEFTSSQAIFIRLLQSLVLPDGEFLDQQQAEYVSNAISDWLDSDNEEREMGGAENNYYSELDLPYRAANRELFSVSEILWVKDVDATILRALKPHVTALPGAVSINVNTAGATVIGSINEVSNMQPLGDSEVQGILAERDSGFDSAGSGLNDGSSGFTAIADFVDAHPADNLDSSRLSVNSDYFLLDASIQFLDRKFRMYSILYRDQGRGEVTTIARANNGLGQCYSVVDNP